MMMNDLGGSLRPRAINDLLGLDAEEKPIFVVSCSKSKEVFSAPAQYLYSSSLFRLSLDVASRTSSDVRILSALHGLIRLESLIDPYDLSLKSLSKKQKHDWAERVASLIDASTGQPVVALAGKSYIEPLIPKLASRGFKLLEPLGGLGLGKRLQFLKRLQRVLDRADLLKRLYDALAVASRLGNRVPLADIRGNIKLPRRGLYIFTDPSELSTLYANQPRIVRVGTHGVSLGSNSTLRSRLRTHMGTTSLSGSHRSSVFRLHVGEAILNSECARELYPSWGRGSTASAEVRQVEASLEQRVSNYIRALYVSVIPLSDEPSVNSSRARIERALIGLITENSDYIDESGPGWLGMSSSKEHIADSGLWNLQYQGAATDKAAVELAISLLETYQRGCQ